MSTLLVQFIFVCFFLTCTRNEKKHLFNNETNKVMMQRLLFENRVQFTCPKWKNSEPYFKILMQLFTLNFYSPIKQNFHQLKRFSAVCKTSLSDNSIQVIVTAVQENKYVQFTRLKTHFKNFATCTLRMDKLSFMQLKTLPLTSDSQCIVLSYMLDKTV